VGELVMRLNSQLKINKEVLVPRRNNSCGCHPISSGLLLHAHSSVIQGWRVYYPIFLVSS
jgi:hypothetical protein